MKNKMISLRSDLKDGSIRRMKPSNNTWDPKEIALSDDQSIDEYKADAIYIELDPKQKAEQPSSSDEDDFEQKEGG